MQRPDFHIVLCDLTARLQDNAMEAVGDLVGAFKNPVAPNSPPPKQAGGMSSLPALPVELDMAESSKPAGKASQKDRRRSTGTSVLARTDSRLSAVPESGPPGTQPGQPPRRNRRSSGFLSLLGYGAHQSTLRCCASCIVIDRMIETQSLVASSRADFSFSLLWWIGRESCNISLECNLMEASTLNQNENDYREKKNERVRKWCNRRQITSMRQCESFLMQTWY